MNTDEDSLVCDFAEYYNLRFDIENLGVRYTSILACGLPDDSRIKKAISGQKLSFSETMLASINDYLALIWWSKTTNAEQGINRPKSVLGAILGKDIDISEHEVYDTVDEFEKRRSEILGG